MTEHKTWDLFIRVFHWALVAGFAANAFLVDENSAAHEWIGYGVLALIGLRLIWGLVGGRYARFRTFWPTRPAILQQLTDIALHRRRAHLGHSPLGALMIFNLLATLLAICGTGYLLTLTDTGWLGDAHEALVVWAELSIAAHILAVVWESLRTGVNLPRAMITGRKRIPDTVNIVE